MTGVSTDELVVTRGLTKRFGRVTAVDDLDLSVRRGDIFGFLGPNGSGKTTTVRMLLGLVLPTSGEVQLLGESGRRGIARVLPKVGALIESPAAYGHLSGRANLRLMDAAGPGGSLRSRRRRVQTALEQVGLAGVGRRQVRHYSLGMRQRLGIASALLREPELLVLDEPTNGLDPQGIREVRELLRDLHARGTTILLSSHLLAEVEQLCTRVGIVDRGRLVQTADIATLKAPTGRTIVRTSDGDRAAGLFGSRLVRASGDLVIVDDPDSSAVNRRLVEAGCAVTEIGPERRTLEQVVLAATGTGSDRVDGPDGRDEDRAGDHVGPQVGDQASVGTEVANDEAADDPAAPGADDERVRQDPTGPVPAADARGDGVR